MALLTPGLGALRPPFLGHPATRRWLFTAGATVLSTYALDAAATVAGLLLAASQLLRGLDHGSVLLFLAGTYVAWGAGLRVNLRANWALLEDTGTSTNVLSKAAYDLVKLRSTSVRARRIASAAAYVATELAKETPYYAGAFGAALFTDSVSANDAIIFLGGANLGAAAYEYGLAHAVRAVLLRRKAPAYAAFETDWVPREYLQHGAAAVTPNSHATPADSPICHSPANARITVLGLRSHAAVTASPDPSTTAGPAHAQPASRFCGHGCGVHSASDSP